MNARERRAGAAVELRKLRWPCRALRQDRPDHLLMVEGREIHLNWFLSWQRRGWIILAGTFEADGGVGRIYELTGEGEEVFDGREEAEESICG